MTIFWMKEGLSEDVKAGIGTDDDDNDDDNEL